MTRRSYDRRGFLRQLSAVTAGLGLSSPALLSGEAPRKRHFVTLSFDDGFRRSSITTAEIHEKFGLSACINVIASAHLPTHELPDEYHKGVKGDFGLWRELRERGHEIMPHGFEHADKSKLTFEGGQDLVRRCMDMFSAELPGFDSAKSVFNFPYNRSTPELERWLPTQVRAFRRGGPAINPLPDRKLVRLTCTSHGPDNIDEHLEGEVDKLLARESGWLIYNTHGIDGEGWGPVSASFLERLLARLVRIDSVKVIPAAAALAEADR